MRVTNWLLTVAGAIWTTGNGVVLIAAFSAFAWAPPHADLITRAGAGAVVGLVLERWSSLVGLPLLLTLFALGWRAGTAWRLRRRNLAAGWVACMAILWGVHSVNHQVVVEANQVLAGIRELAAKPDADAARDSLEKRFAALHRSSERWHGMETLLALAVLVGGSVGVLRAARPATTAQDPASPSVVPA